MQGHAYVLLLYVDNNNYTELPVKLLSCIIVLFHKGKNVNKKSAPVWQNEFTTIRIHCPAARQTPKTRGHRERFSAYDRSTTIFKLK